MAQTVGEVSMAALGYLNMFAHDIQRMASFYADLFQLEEIREAER